MENYFHHPIGYFYLESFSSRIIISVGFHLNFQNLDPKTSFPYSKRTFLQIKLSSIIVSNRRVYSVVLFQGYGLNYGEPFPSFLPAMKFRIYSVVSASETWKLSFKFHIGRCRFEFKTLSRVDHREIVFRISISTSASRISRLDGILEIQPRYVCTYMYMRDFSFRRLREK